MLTMLARTLNHNGSCDEQETITVFALIYFVQVHNLSATIIDGEIILKELYILIDTQL